MRICHFPHQHRRREYWTAVPQYFDVSDDERSQYQRDTLLTDCKAVWPFWADVLMRSEDGIRTVLF